MNPTIDPNQTPSLFQLLKMLQPAAPAPVQQPADPNAAAAQGQQPGQGQQYGSLGGALKDLGTLGTTLGNAGTSFLGFLGL